MTVNEEAVNAAMFKVESVHHIHGTQCLCGFESAVSRDRTRHLIDVTMEAAAPHIRAQALTDAADVLDRFRVIARTPYRECAHEDLGAYYVYVQMTPEAWLRARAAEVRGQG